MPHAKGPVAVQPMHTPIPWPMLRVRWACDPVTGGYERTHSGKLTPRPPTGPSKLMCHTEPANPPRAARPIVRPRTHAPAAAHTGSTPAPVPQSTQKLPGL